MPAAWKDNERLTQERRPPVVAYTLVDAAQASGVSVDTLRKALHTTDPRSYPPPLRAKRAGKRYLILADELERWLESLPDA
jgi:hypothetical protein